MDSDSDFYGDQRLVLLCAYRMATDSLSGDDEEVCALQARVDAFDPAEYWRKRSIGASATPAKSIKREPGSPPKFPPSPSPTSFAATTQFHNPYEGRYSCAKQLSETTEAFLARLPPSTTEVSPDCPWIFVANPFIPREDRGGDEAPAEFGAQLGRFVEGGEARLEMLGDLVRELQERTAAAGGSQRGGRTGRPSKAAINREVTKQREGCANDILMLAKVLKVRTGKVSRQSMACSTHDAQKSY